MDILKHEYLKDLVTVTHDGLTISPLIENYAKLYSSIFSKSKKEIKQNESKQISSDRICFFIDDSVTPKCKTNYVSDEFDKKLICDYFKTNVSDISLFLSHIIIPQEDYIDDCFNAAIRDINVWLNKYQYWDTDWYSTIQFRYNFKIKDYLNKCYEIFKQRPEINKKYGDINIAKIFDNLSRTIEIINKIFAYNYHRSHKESTENFNMWFDRNYKDFNLDTIKNVSTIEVVRYVILQSISNIWSAISGETINIEDLELINVISGISEDIDEDFYISFELKSQKFPRMWWDKRKSTQLFKSFKVKELD